MRRAHARWTDRGQRHVGSCLRRLSRLVRALFRAPNVGTERNLGLGRRVHVR